MEGPVVEGSPGDSDKSPTGSEGQQPGTLKSPRFTIFREAGDKH